MNVKERLQNLPPSVKDWGIFAAWIGGLLLTGILCWALTGPARSRALLRQANRSLARQERPLALETPLPTWGRPGRVTQAGSWFSLAGSEKYGVVFTLMSGSQNMVVLGVVDEEGAVEELIPLSANALSQFQIIPEGTRDIYIRRIKAGVPVPERRNE
jgi:hypothetical protein